MRNPLDPKLRSGWAADRSLKVKAQELQVLQLPISSDMIKDNFVFEEGKGGSQEASVLSGYFKTSYRLASMEGAFNKVNEELKEYHTVYALLNHSGEIKILPEESRQWTSAPQSESEPYDVNTALELFLRIYGSHYVSQIKYGLRIGIQVSLQKSSSVTKD